MSKKADSAFPKGRVRPIIKFKKRETTGIRLRLDHPLVLGSLHQAIGTNCTNLERPGRHWNKQF